MGRVCLLLVPLTAKQVHFDDQTGLSASKWGVVPDLDLLASFPHDLHHENDVSGRPQRACARTARKAISYPLYHLFLEEWQLDGGRSKLEENHAVELYNLKDDIGERNDLADKNIAKRDELLEELPWHKSVKAKLPSQPNPDYDPKATAQGRGRKHKVPSDKE